MRKNGTCLVGKTNLHSEDLGMIDISSTVIHLGKHNILFHTITTNYCTLSHHQKTVISEANIELNSNIDNFKNSQGYQRQPNR